MKRIVTLFLIGAAAVTTDCGEPLPPRHPLALVFPQIACMDRPPPCVDYAGCYDLGITTIYVEVGTSHPEDTKILCTTAGGPAIPTHVYYQPGQDSYVINATYTRNGATVAIRSGPFSEDDSLTPWKLQLQ